MYRRFAAQNPLSNGALTFMRRFAGHTLKINPSVKALR